MRKLLNTLYVTSQGSYIHKEGETIIVEREQQKVLQLPVHTLGGIVCFGNVLCSPFLLGFCAEHDISISFLTEYGSFLASVRGPVSGNVLLRREQYRIADNSEKSAKIAANIVTGKLMNSRLVMNRAIRDHGDKIDIATIRRASSSIYRLIEEDPVNALLSFIYTLLVHDVRSALETVGLDPTVGFLHRDRPGRPGLALDLMEEFRPVIADRLVLSLINRRQVAPNGFKKAESGAVVMDDSTRKTVLVEYQNRKQDEIFHPYIEEKIPLGLLFFVQANLMARFIRGDIDGYPPFFWR